MTDLYEIIQEFANNLYYFVSKLLYEFENMQHEIDLQKGDK